VRNPYTTGGWVSGHEHYGRETLIANLLESPDDAFWVIGNRRMGKTSLLHQLEFLTLSSHIYVPLFLDLQGIASLDDLAIELIYAVEEAQERFEKLVVDVDLLRNWDAVGVIRLLRRYARAADRVLLLLIDEAEALLAIAERDPLGLAKLRKALQDYPGMRVVMTSTKLLSKLNEVTAGWETSPFLFGFALRNLAGLQDEASTALIRRTQDAEQVRVSDDLLQQIRQLTNSHPYLTQVLCNRLFEDEGYLRPLADADLALDSTLDGFFRNDFRWLSPGEREVLVSVAIGDKTVDSISSDTGLPPVQVQEFVYSLDRLGQIRMTEAGFALGNEFLRRWLRPIVHQALHAPPGETEPARPAEGPDYASLLAVSGERAVSDETTRQLIHEGQEQEAHYALEQLQIQRANLADLEAQKVSYGARVPLSLINEINQVKVDIQELERRLVLILPDILEAVRRRTSGAPDTPRPGSLTFGSDIPYRQGAR
jgi:hypothetical protein